MANSDMREVIKLERKIYEEMKAREDASRQREADETADMFNERELARLQDENRRLRAFMEEHLAIYEQMPLVTHSTNLDLWNAEMARRYAIFGIKAAALLASMKPAEDSDATE